MGKDKEDKDKKKDKEKKDKDKKEKKDKDYKKDKEKKDKKEKEKKDKDKKEKESKRSKEMSEWALKVSQIVDNFIIQFEKIVNIFKDIDNYILKEVESKEEFVEKVQKVAADLPEGSKQVFSAFLDNLP